jgi:hypothetical protein
MLPMPQHAPGPRYDHLPGAGAGRLLPAVCRLLNSSIHSYLVVRYAEGDKVAMNVGFYYMANALGRLTGW